MEERLEDWLHIFTEAYILSVFNFIKSVHGLFSAIGAIILKLMLQQISSEQQQINTQNKYVHVCLCRTGVNLLGNFTAAISELP